MDQAAPKVTIAWGAVPDVSQGGAFGYSRANEELYLSARAQGMGVDDTADTVVHVCWPGYWNPAPGKRNVMFTMYESGTLHRLLREKLPLADLILTPSAWSAQQLARCTDVPIKIVPLGVDTDHFVGVKRPRPKFTRERPFVWLWMGHWNIRKGMREVQEAWAKSGWHRDPGLALYLKTADVDNPTCERDGNVIRDARPLSNLDLLKVFANADGFVFPTMGEGFGLTLLEAMATALPCIAPLRGGVSEFADETVCLGVKTHSYLSSVNMPGYDTHYEACVKVEVDSLIEKMRWVMEHWHQARRMGLRAWKRAKQYTWKRAGERLVEALVEFEEGVKPCHFSQHAV